MTDNNEITITTTPDTNCEVCDFREETWCRIFCRDLEFVDTEEAFNIYRCQECLDAIGPT